MKLKLIEDDYAIFRQFEGRSSLRTYLVTVIGRLLLDYQDHLWGKWRCSAEAKRLGPVAMRLERMLGRDGYSLGESIQILRVTEKVEMSELELRDLAERLPPRVDRRFVDEGELETERTSAPGPKEDLEEKERQGLSEKVCMTLLGCLKALPEEERVLVLERQQRSVAERARLGQGEQKALYRRLEKIYDVLRVCLGRHGVRRKDVQGALNL